MSEVSGTHGPREDDAIKRELRGDLQAKRETRVEEWREGEPAGEDEPEATWAPEGKPGGTPQGEGQEVIEMRSDLARHLDRNAFPATRARLLGSLREHQAEQQLLDLVSALPDDKTTYENLHDVLTALGIGVEERPS